MSAWFTRVWIALINATAGWAIARRTRWARVLGDLLWVLVRPRRRVTLANLRACFPKMPDSERSALGRACFRNIARSVLDHGLLWTGTREQVEDFVTLQGFDDLLALSREAPLIMLVPHFVGLDAAAIRVSLEMRGFAIFARQSNPVWDNAANAGRNRFTEQLLIPRNEQGALRRSLRALNSGLPMYYLPDMDNGKHNSIFVPFFGVQAATLPMLSRLARLAGAKVVMLVAEMTDRGYIVHWSSPWKDFPTGSVEDDTLRMNREIEVWVRRFPDQYLWVHRRFKTRPWGAPPIY
jgi:Kdo2-lipid IVA lauroyltransferase/acyltransferase